jgi:hypothetical protein
MAVRFLHRGERSLASRALNVLILRRLDKAAPACVRAGGIEGQAGFMNGIRDMER